MYWTLWAKVHINRSLLCYCDCRFVIECSRGKVKRTSTTSKRKPWTKVEASQYWRDIKGIKVDNTGDLVETKKGRRGTGEAYVRRKGRL